MALSITNDSFQAGTAIVASEINTNFTEVENYINNSMASLGTAAAFTATIAFNAGITVAGTSTYTGDITIGASTAGRDVKFYGNSSGHYMEWDASSDGLVFTADSAIYFFDVGGEKIQAASDGQLNINAGTLLQLTAPATKFIGEALIQDQACIRDDATPATITDRLLALRTQTSGMVPLLALAETAVAGTTPVAGIFMIGAEGDGTNPDTNDYWLLFRKGNGDTIGSVQGTGTNQVAFQTSSDQTLKNDLGVVTEASSVIDALQVHKFTWKDADSKVGEHIGLFAQEAIEVLPYGIVSPADTRIEDGEEMYIPAGIDYSKIVPFLIAEIQSLRARVAAVEG
mgnify:CR=1 FL=1